MPDDVPSGARDDGSAGRATVDTDGPRDADPATTEALLDREAPIEPGRPTLENATFVLLGVIVALVVLARLVLLFA